jgi:prevent-host-death family protein
MHVVNIHEAKTHLSRLLQAVAAGEEIIIAKAGTPVARLTSIADDFGRRVGGKDRGTVTVPNDFDAPLPDELLEEFER